MTKDNSTSKLIAALITNPGSTSIELHTIAGIGRSTAGKILAQLENVGQATRAKSSNRSLPDRWHPTDTILSAIQTSDATGDHIPDKPATTLEQPADSSKATIDTTRSTNITDETMPATPLPSTDQPATNHTPTTDTAAKREKAHDREQPPVTTITRLGANALRGMVEDHLLDHPDSDHTPYHIGRHLNRSSGAVANALERLVAAGTAIRTNDAPRRYRLAAPNQ